MDPFCDRLQAEFDKRDTRISELEIALKPFADFGLELEPKSCGADYQRAIAAMYGEIQPALTRAIREDRAEIIAKIQRSLPPSAARAMQEITNAIGLERATLAVNEILAAVQENQGA